MTGREEHDPLSYLVAAAAAAADAAGELDAATAAYQAAEERVFAAIRAAERGGLSQIEITRRSPYSRMTVRKILADG